MKTIPQIECTFCSHKTYIDEMNGRDGILLRKPWQPYINHTIELLDLSGTGPVHRQST